MISSFIVNYTPFAQRRKNAIQCLKGINLDPLVISIFDKEELSVNGLYSFDPNKWREGLNTFGSQLYANAGIEPNSFGQQHIPSWMEPRQLVDGELSVLMKHFYAICSIANSQNKYGLIAEDDILFHTNSLDLWDKTISSFSKLDGDYLDLAGGCNLKVENLKPDQYITMLDKPNTRTNACYLLSNRVAKFIAKNFFPLIYPIDWHLLYLLSSTRFSFYWTNDPVFIHGSETRAFKSWRD